jgi:hypothetical protein
MRIAGMYAEPCPACAGPVLPALDPGGAFNAIEPHDDGMLVAAPDENGIGYFRAAVPGEQITLGELLCRLHDPVCPVLAKRVVPIQQARSLRRRIMSGRTAGSARRTASAR